MPHAASRQVPSSLATGSLVKRAQLASLLLLGCISLAVAADKAAQLSDDFLEYLGNLEGDDDNWMDFSADAAANSESVTKPQAAAKPDSKPVRAASSSSASSQALHSPARAASANSSAMSQVSKTAR